MTLADYGFSPEPFSTLFILIVLLLGVVFVIGLIIYALKAVAYYDMSKTLQIKSEWFGFIPFLRDIACGNIAEGKQKSRYGVTLIALSIVYTVFSLIYVCTPRWQGPPISAASIRGQRWINSQNAL